MFGVLQPSAGEAERSLAEAKAQAVEVLLRQKSFYFENIFISDDHPDFHKCTRAFRRDKLQDSCTADF